MQLFSKKNKNYVHDKQFVPLRIFGVAATLLFLIIITFHFYIFINKIYRQKNTVAELTKIQSTGLPHSIQFDRLEKVESNWLNKTSGSKPTIVKDPFLEAK